ncbi:unnamed protein product, partial [Effrenium voratum]
VDSFPVDGMPKGRWRKSRANGGNGGNAAGRRQRFKKKGGWPQRIRSHLAEDLEPGEPGEEPVEEVKETISFQQLTPEQQTAATRALSGESLFLTGAAGTGKSFLLRYLIQELQELYPGQVAVTASTGVAASHLAGQTLHSFAGIGLGTGSFASLKKKVQKAAVAERWKKTRVLVVDEISMLDSRLLDLLSKLASAVRGNTAAFGGLQVLLCGDFLQLPPVQERGKSAQFCFHAAAWRQAGLEEGTVLLRQPVRQQADAAFAEVLNEMRVGIVSEKANAMLASCHVKVKTPPADGILPTRLYCLNRNVDAENAKRLAQLPGEEVVLRARDQVPRRCSALQRSALDRKVPALLKLKPGAQVIHLRNEPSLGLVNGHRGRVEAFEGGMPVVRFDNGKRVCIGVQKFTQGSGSSSLTRFQVPLKLGWALTVHKAQGMTLTRAELQLDDAFEAGQSYVALSRLTGTEGLWLRGKMALGCRAHPEVLRFYEAAQCGKLPAAKLDPAKAAQCGKLPAAKLDPAKVASPLLALPGPQRLQRKRAAGLTPSPKRQRNVGSANQ